jgi:hypothetical protein
MAVTYTRGSNSDLNYIITGGGSPQDSRLMVLDARMIHDDGRCPLIQSWEGHNNGIYSLCVIGDDVVLSGDGVGMLHCHHLIPNAEELEARGSDNGLVYGLGASSQGAVRSIHCLSGKIVTAGEDGKALVFDYEE